MTSKRAKVGDQIYVPTEKKPYRVRCRDDRFIICTKPINIYHTVLYFIIDLKERMRGPDNMAFCFGYETDEDCLANLKRLQNGTMEVSIRRGIPLDIDIE